MTRWLDNPLIYLSSAAVFGFVIIASALLIVPNNLSAKRRLCDRMVEALLTSPDLVEVTRAAAIVRHLDCSISRRLPRE